MNTYAKHTGDAWNSWTPTVAQSVGVTVTVSRASYFRAGRLISWNCQLTVTGSGSAGQPIYVLLPVSAANSLDVHGSGYLYDASSGLYYPCIVAGATSTTVQLLSTSVGTAVPTLGSVSFTAALAAGDQISLAGTYEAAS